MVDHSSRVGNDYGRAGFASRPVAVVKTWHLQVGVAAKRRVVFTADRSRAQAHKAWRYFGNAHI